MLSLSHLKGRWPLPSNRQSRLGASLPPDLRAGPQPHLRFLLGALVSTAFACGGSSANQNTTVPTTPPPSFFGAELLRIDVTELRATPLHADVVAMAQNMPQANNRRFVELALARAQTFIVGGAASNENDTAAWMRLLEPDTQFAQTLQSFGLQAQTDPASGVVFAQGEEQGEAFRIAQLTPYEYLLVTGNAWTAAIATFQEQTRHRREPGQSVEPNAFVHGAPQQVAFAYFRVDLNEVLGIAENANAASLGNQGALQNVNKVPVEISVLRNATALNGSMIVYEQSAEAATALATRAQAGLANARANPMLAMFGLGAIMNSITIETRTNEVHGSGVFPFDDLRRILAIVGARVGAM